MNDETSRQEYNADKELIHRKIIEERERVKNLPAQERTWSILTDTALTQEANNVFKTLPDRMRYRIVAMFTYQMIIECQKAIQ